MLLLIISLLTFICVCLVGSNIVNCFEENKCQSNTNKLLRGCDGADLSNSGTLSDEPGVLKNSLFARSPVLGSDVDHQILEWAMMQQRKKQGSASEKVDKEYKTAFGARLAGLVGVQMYATSVSDQQRDSWVRWGKAAHSVEAEHTMLGNKALSEVVKIGKMLDNVGSVNRDMYFRRKRSFQPLPNMLRSPKQTRVPNIVWKGPRNVRGRLKGEKGRPKQSRGTPRATKDRKRLAAKGQGIKGRS